MGRARATKKPHRRVVTEQPLSKGQRKRAIKKSSLINKITNTGRVQDRQEAEDGRVLPAARVLPNATAGESALPSRATRAQPRDLEQAAFQRVVSNKGKKTLMAAEMRQLNAVLDTVSFQQDPFAAIQAHLRQTAYPPIAESQKMREPAKALKVAKAKAAINRNAGKPSRGAAGDRKRSAKPYKGRNAKMRVK